MGTERACVRALCVVCVLCKIKKLCVCEGEVEWGGKEGPMVGPPQEQVAASRLRDHDNDTVRYDTRTT